MRNTLLRRLCLRLRERRLSAGRFICLLLVMYSSGCQKPPRGIPRGAVSGVVMCDNKPLAEGVIFFFSPATGIATGAVLQAEGKFRIEGGVEIGDYVVSVSQPSTGGDGLGGPAARKSSPVMIPKQYLSLEDSKLMFEVKPGHNEAHFQLN